MKKILFIIAALVCAVPAVSAQDIQAILDKVARMHDGGIPVERRFVEKRTDKVKKTGETLTGKLKFRKPDTFIMNYDNGEDFVIDGKLMTIARGGNPLQFDLSKNKLMAGLSHTLLYSFCGTLKELAEEQKSGIKAIKTKDGYLVTLEAKKKMPRGYSKVEVLYSLTDCTVVNVLLEEFTGLSTFYSWE